MDISNPRRRVIFKLLMSFTEKKLNGSKVAFINGQVSRKLGPTKIVLMIGSVTHVKVYGYGQN